MPDLTIDVAARRLGGIVWLERRLFEVLGEWSTSTPEPAVQLAFARRSRHHGSHAVALAALLPETRDHDPEVLTRAPDDAVATAVVAIAARSSSAERLAGLVTDLLPVQVRACEGFLAEASPVRDGPVIRALIPVLAEERVEVTDLAALGRSLG